MSLSMFTAGDGDQLVPTDVARSMWSRDQMHGVAVSGAMARAIERALPGRPGDDLRPARYTLDMFRPATMSPFAIDTTVVREGRRICLVDAVLVQDGGGRGLRHLPARRGERRRAHRVRRRLARRRACRGDLRRASSARDPRCRPIAGTRARG